VSRRVGNAVKRNRVKRCVREWFRRARGGWRQDVDLVVIARPGAAELSGEEIRCALDALSRELGIASR
jgi:ribonuclease P protein component